jgi:hypothetical protein
LDPHKGTLDSNNQDLRGKTPSHNSHRLRRGVRRRRCGPGAGQQMGLLRDWAHQLSIDVLGADGDVASERLRRSNGGAAAGVRFPAR